MLGAAVQYDASGDVTEDNQNQYLYNGDGQLCAVKNTYAGTMTGYVYGADGTRVSTGTITTWGSCDPSVNGYQALKDSIAGPTGGQLTETGVDADGNVTWAHTNVWAGGTLLATYDPNGIHFNLNDWNGSRRVQTDYEGNMEQTCANLPYGNGEICTPTPSEFLYAGLQRDAESGLDHAMYRQYSSTFGQWTAPDPYGGSYNWSNPQSLNRYAYVGGNPLAMGDPSGLDPCPPDPSIVGYCVLLYGIGHASDLNSIVFTDSLSDFAGGITPLVGGAILFYDLGRSAGWWGSSPFHGNVAASQNGKNVPSTGAASVPGPPEDGMADNPLAQALFHGGGQPYWGGANSMVTDATVAYTGAIGAGIGGPAAFDYAMTNIAESLGAEMATANGTNGVVVGQYLGEASEFSYQNVAAANGMNAFNLTGTADWGMLNSLGYGQVANDAFINAAINSGQTIYTSSELWTTGGFGYMQEAGLLSNAGATTVPFF